MGFGRAEAAYPWGQDLQIGPNGDFVVLVDTPGSPGNPGSSPATLQRIVQLIQTNAMDTAADFFGNTVTLRPDDLFNPNYGSSIRRLIGANNTSALLGEIKARLLLAFQSDPGISKNPAPSVSVTYRGNHIVLNQIQVYDLTGTLILIPDQAISAFGTFVGS